MPYQSSALQVCNILISYRICFSNRAQHFYVTSSYMEDLKHLLRLYEEGHLSAVALDKALNVLSPPIKELSRLLQLHNLGYIGYKALDSALCVLKPPSEDMDAEETVEPYDEA